MKVPPYAEVEEITKWIDEHMQNGTIAENTQVTESEGTRKSIKALIAQAFGPDSDNHDKEECSRLPLMIQPADNQHH